MDLGLESAGVLVAGGDGALGGAAAAALAAEGARVLVVGRDQAALEATLAQMRHVEGAEAQSFVADLAADGAAERAAADCRDAFGRIDALIWAFSDRPPPGDAERSEDASGEALLSEAAWSKAALRAAEARILLPPKRMIAAALPQMRAQGGGRIVMLLEPVFAPNVAAETAMSALAALLEALAPRLAAEGITLSVSQLAPETPEEIAAAGRLAAPALALSALEVRGWAGEA